MKKIITKGFQKIQEKVDDIMGYVPPEVVEKIKKMDLITYFQNCEPNELVRDSRTQYSTKSHSSLKMSNRMLELF